jgi:hypothetical protein
MDGGEPVERGDVRELVWTSPARRPQDACNRLRGRQWRCCLPPNQAQSQASRRSASNDRRSHRAQFRRRRSGTAQCQVRGDRAWCGLGRQWETAKAAMTSVSILKRVEIRDRAGKVIVRRSSAFADLIAVPLMVEFTFDEHDGPFRFIRERRSPTPAVNQSYPATRSCVSLKLFRASPSSARPCDLESDLPVRAEI